jgi:O-antigen/teichoic acid export membrane protein
VSIYTQSRARRSVIDTVTYRVLSQTTTLLGYIVMVRAMRKEDFGVYSLLYSFIPVVSTVASLGLEQTLRRYQPEYLHAGNVRAAAWLVRFVSSARFGANVIILAAILLAWNHVAPLFQLTPYRGPFMFFCLLILLHFQVQIMQMTLASHMMQRFSVGAIAVLSVSKLIGYSTLVLFSTITLEHAIISDTIAYAVTLAFVRTVYLLHCRRNNATGPYKPPPEERRRLFTYGLYNNFNDAGTLFLDAKMDNFFIAAFIDPISVGIYAFYSRLGEMMSNISPLRLFDNVIQPMFFATRKADADKRIPQYFTLLLNINFVPWWPVLAFSIAYHAEVVQVVFGGKFIEYSWLLPLMVLFGMLNSVATPVTLVAQYDERAGLILLSKVTAAYNVVAMLALLPLLGLYGAALARGSAVVLKNCFIWWNVRSRAVWGNAGSFLLSGGVLWGTVVLLALALKDLVPMRPVLQLGVGVLLCAGATLIYLRTPAISHSDRNLLASLFHGKEARVLRRLGLLRTADGPTVS